VITTRRWKNIPYPTGKRVCTSHSTCNCVWCDCGK